MIRRCSLAAFVAASLVVISSPSFSQTKPKITVPAEKPLQAKALVAQLLKEGKIIRSSSVKRGMMGYGLSVFQGTKIEKFPIVVLGNLERVQGGGDIILIKVLGGPVVQRQTGIIAGMSGSPVFINGKMLGAIALGWGFPKEPIGGVTPITEMIETSLPDPARAKPSTPIPTAKPATVAYAPSTPLTLAGHKIARMEISRDSKRLALRGPESGATMTMRPVDTLLQVSGFSEKSLTRLKQVFEPYQITPMIGPSSKKTVAAPPIEPGSAMGVQLVSGDMDQTAVGTITFRYGNRILGFGHPMFGQGASSLPLTSAYVHEIFPSYQRSFKLASPIATAGAIQQDTQFAVGGTLGAKADTIPMSISIAEAARNIQRTYNVQVMKDPILTPQLIVAVASEAIETKLGLTSDKMVRVSLKMEIENAPPVVRTNYLYANDVVTQAALVDLTQTLMLTQMNEFGKGSVKRVDLSVVVEEGRQTAIIKAMTANKNKIKAGETVSVSVQLEPTTTPGKTVTRTFQFKVPEDSPTGVLRLAASASVNFWPLQVRVGGAPPEPTNLRELMTAWNKVGSYNELMVQASTPRQFLQVDDQKISNPAPSWSRLMQNARTTTVGAYNETEVRRQSTPYMLDGAQFLTIPVESANNDDQATAAATEGDASVVTPVVVDETPIEATPLPDFNDEAATDDDRSTQSDSTRFAAPPANGRWGNSDENKDWSQQFAPPALLKPYFKASSKLAPKPSEQQAGKEVPSRNEGDRPVAGSAPAPGATPTPTPAPVPTPTPVPTPAPIVGSKGVGRPAQSWIQSGAPDFLKGKFDGAFVNSTGEIKAAPAVKQIAQTSEPFVWSIAGDNAGNVYLGTGLSSGNKARILKVDASGKQSVFWQGDGVAVTALVIDSAGTLYAGVAPSGKVIGINRNGKSTMVADSDKGFVWSLSWKDDELLIAIGGEEGQIIAIPNAAQEFKNIDSTNGLAAHTEVSVPQKHIRSISSLGNDIFFGTGADGVLYRFNHATRKLDALWQAGDAKTAASTEVLAVAAAPEGVYFGTSANGNIYRWSETGGVETIYSSPQKSIFALERTPDGTLYAATGDAGVVYQIRPSTSAEDTRVARLLEPDQRQALALATVANNLLVGTGNGGAAYRVNLQNDADGTYLSPIFDAKSNVRWGTLRYLGSGANIETRSGNTFEPDVSWSDWQSAKSNDLGELSVASPAARYLQYRVRVSGNQSTPDAEEAAISRIEVIYRAPNVAPEITLNEPKEGAYWMGKKKINWTGKDTNNDALQYRVEISSDNGKTWTQIGDKNLQTAALDWDTKLVSDGIYRIRITANDAIANPEDPRGDQKTSQPFVVDNTAPVLDASLISQDGMWRLVGIVNDATSPITGAEWRFAPRKKDAASTPVTPLVPAAIAPTAITAIAPMTATNATVVAALPAAPSTPAIVTPAAEKAKEGNWQAISAADGIFDSRREALAALISNVLLPDSSIKDGVAVAGKTAPVASDFQVEIRVYDAAGNSKVLTLDLP